jgi:hypothetical protein
VLMLVILERHRKAAEREMVRDYENGKTRKR